MKKVKNIEEISIKELEKISGGMDSGSSVIDDAWELVKGVPGKVNGFYSNIKNGKYEFANGIISTTGYSLKKSWDGHSKWEFSKSRVLNFSGIVDEDEATKKRWGLGTGMFFVIVGGSFLLTKIKKYLNIVC